VKFWVAFGETPLAAVNVIGYVPALLAEGVPASVPVPFPLLVNVTPLGSVPELVIVGAGEPVVVTVKVPADPATNVVAFGLVNAGAVLTVRVKFWVAFGEMPLVAVKVRGYVPAVPAAGMPDRVPVPLPLLTNVTPLGRVPERVMVGGGEPVVVTVKLLADPATNVVLFGLVNAGACGGLAPMATFAANSEVF
jgi:hypothetical protein